MDVTPLIPKGRLLITGYGAGGFKINQEPLHGSLLVTAEARWGWVVSDPRMISEENIAPILGVMPKIEILLIGTGKTMAFLDSGLKDLLRKQGIATDVMDTGAACRTYNVLMAEERRVGAALIAV